MADVSIIIATNAEQASKEIKGLSNSVLNASDKALKMTKAFDFLDRAFNKGKISASQYQTATSALDASEDALYASIGKTTQAVQQQSAAAQAAAASVDRLADEAEMLSMKYKAGYAAGKQLAASTKELNTALKLGVISAKQHKLQIAELGREYQRTGKYSKGFSAMQRMAGKSTNKFGMYSQQVGYQVGDFAVQVQSGTNALVAFGQQGTQLAGLLPGLTGAVLGIGLAIGTAVARSVLDAKKLEIDFKAVISELKKPLESIKPIVEAISGAFKSTGGAAVSVLSTLANNLDRVVLYITVAATAFGVKLVAGLVAARLATFTLAGAFAFLRTAIIRTAIGALIIGVAEAIRMFMLLKKQIGGVGPLLDLFKRVFVEVLDKVALKFQWLAAMTKAKFYQIKQDALTALSDLLSNLNSDFINKFVGMFVGAVKAVGVIVGSIPDIFVAVFMNVKRAVAQGINDFTGVIGSGINGLRNALFMEKIDFGDVIKMDEIPSGDVSGVFAETRSGIRTAYDAAVAVEYVAAAQNGLADAINNTDKARTSALNDAVSLDASYRRQGTALAELSALYDSTGSSSDIEFSNMLKTATDDDDGDSGSSSKDPIKKLKAEIALNTQLLTMSKEKAAVLTRVIAIQKTLADQGKTFDEDKLIALVKQNEELVKQRGITQGLTDFIGSSMETAMMGIVDGTLSVKDAFKSMAREIIKELYRVLVVQEMVAAAKEALDNRGGIVSVIKSILPFADGGAFSGGSQIQAYANGGVVNSPTTFPMSGGQTGLMGEAGPEAIMPLKRGANGKLGVQMEGGRSGDNIVINQSFNFQANGDDTVKKLIAQAAPKIADMAKASVIDSRRRGGSTKAAFG